MDCNTWFGIIGIIGTVASVIGAAISIYQCKKAKEAKEASEAAKEATINAQTKIFKHLQFEQFSSFKSICDKFIRFLQIACSSNDERGKSKTYVEDELEKFLTKLNEALSNASGEERKNLEKLYSSLQAKRRIVRSDDKATIKILLDEARNLMRAINDIQISNKMSV